MICTRQTLKCQTNWKCTLTDTFNTRTCDPLYCLLHLYIFFYIFFKSLHLQHRHFAISCICIWQWMSENLQHLFRNKTNLISVFVWQLISELSTNCSWAQLERPPENFQALYGTPRFIITFRYSNK
jgi:hypothetical protein